VPEIRKYRQSSPKQQLFTHTHPSAHQATEGFDSLSLCHVRQQYTKADPKLQVLILKMDAVPIENYKLRVSEFLKGKTIVNTYPCKTPNNRNISRAITCSAT
jgi:hypothetical protein